MQASLIDGVSQPGLSGVYINSILLFVRLNRCWLFLKSVVQVF